MVFTAHILPKISLSKASISAIAEHSRTSAESIKVCFCLVSLFFDVANRTWPTSAIESKFTNACSKSDYFESMVAKANLGDENAKRLVNAYHYGPEIEFFDIQSDPLELNNLATDPAWKLEMSRLSQELEKWMSSQGDEGVLTEMKARERQATKRKFKKK